MTLFIYLWSGGRYKELVRIEGNKTSPEGRLLLGRLWLPVDENFVFNTLTSSPDVILIKINKQRELVSESADALVQIGVDCIKLGYLERVLDMLRVLRENTENYTDVVFRIASECAILGEYESICKLKHSLDKSDRPMWVWGAIDGLIRSGLDVEELMQLARRFKNNSSSGFEDHIPHEKRIINAARKFFELLIKNGHLEYSYLESLDDYLLYYYLDTLFETVSKLLKSNKIDAKVVIAFLFYIDHCLSPPFLEAMMYTKWDFEWALSRAFSVLKDRLEVEQPTADEYLEFIKQEVLPNLGYPPLKAAIIERINRLTPRVRGIKDEKSFSEIFKDVLWHSLLTSRDNFMLEISLSLWNDLLKILNSDNKEEIKEFILGGWPQSCRDNNSYSHTDMWRTVVETLWMHGYREIAKDLSEILSEYLNINLDFETDYPQNVVLEHETKSYTCSKSNNALVMVWERKVPGEIRPISSAAKYQRLIYASDTDGVNVVSETREYSLVRFEPIMGGSYLSEHRFAITKTSTNLDLSIKGKDCKVHPIQGGLIIQRGNSLVWVTPKGLILKEMILHEEATVHFGNKMIAVNTKNRLYFFDIMGTPLSEYAIAEGSTIVMSGDSLIVGKVITESASSDGCSPCEVVTVFSEGNVKWKRSYPLPDWILGKELEYKLIAEGSSVISIFRDKKDYNRYYLRLYSIADGEIVFEDSGDLVNKPFKNLDWIPRLESIKAGETKIGTILCYHISGETGCDFPYCTGNTYVVCYSVLLRAHILVVGAEGWELRELSSAIRNYELDWGGITINGKIRIKWQDALAEFQRSGTFLYEDIEYGWWKEDEYEGGIDVDDLIFKANVLKLDCPALKSAEGHPLHLRTVAEFDSRDPSLIYLSTMFYFPEGKKNVVLNLSRLEEDFDIWYFGKKLERGEWPRYDEIPGNSIVDTVVILKPKKQQRDSYRICLEYEDGTQCIEFQVKEV